MKRIALITGCSSGIGEALTRNFLHAGWTVYATARQPDTLNNLTSLGAHPLVMDLMDEDSVAAGVAHVLEGENHIDMLINNAGYGAMGPLAEMPVAEIRRQFQANLFGQMAVIQAVVPSMIERGQGHVVNIGSITGILPTPFSGAYAASKAAFHAASEALRLELAPFGIKVVMVQPGGIASKFSTNAESNLKKTTCNLHYYAASMEAIVRRARISQESAMPLDRFADTLTTLLLRAEVPPVIRLGTHSTLLPFLKKWVPIRLRDKILMKKLTKKR